MIHVPRRISNIIGVVARQSALIAWSLLVLVPFVLIFMLSLRSNMGIFTHPLSLAGPYDVANYSQAWSGPPDAAGMVDYFRNTVLAAMVTVLISLAVGSLCAYFGTRLRPKAQRRLLRIFLVSAVVPIVLIIIPLYQGYNALHVLNNPAILGIAYGSLALPTTVLILFSFYTDFPRELVEAAQIDGLGDYSVYARIVLPLSKAPLTAVGIITLVYVWGEAQIGIVLLQRPHSQTAAVGVLGFVGQWQASFGPMFAGLSLATIPVLILYLVFNRFVTKGLALGAALR
jgi:raffinose/stachyose/melibiose transport system permease protein